MRVAAAVALTLMGCSSFGDVGSRASDGLEANSQRPEPSGYPGFEIDNRILATNRPNDEAAAALVFDVLGVDRYPLPTVTWLEGAPCGDREDAITHRQHCYAGVTFQVPAWCVPYVLWPRGLDTIAGTYFAHELTHCASLRLGLGMDPGHTGWLWGELPAVESALEAEGL